MLVLLVMQVCSRYFGIATMRRCLLKANVSVIKHTFNFESTKVVCITCSLYRPTKDSRMKRKKFVPNVPGYVG